MSAPIIATTILASCLLWLTGSADAEVRSFTDKDDRTIKGEILAVHGERVEMKVSGKKFVFPIANLSADDQAYVKKWATLNKAYKLDFSIQAVEDPKQRKEGNDPSPLNIALLNVPVGGIPGRNQSDRDVKARTTAWRYIVTVHNRSGEDLGEFSIKYNVMVRNKLAIQGDGNAESHSTVVGGTRIPALANTRKAHLATDWLEMRERDWESEKLQSTTDRQTGSVHTEKYWVDYSESTQLDGMWIKVFISDQQVAEWKSEGKAIKDAVWSDESKLVRTPHSVTKSRDRGTRGSRGPGKTTAAGGYLPHEDLQPIPKIPDQFKGSFEISKLQIAAVNAGALYQKADESRKGSERRKAMAEYDAALAAYKAAIAQ